MGFRDLVKRLSLERIHYSGVMGRKEKIRVDPRTVWFHLHADLKQNKYTVSPLSLGFAPTDSTNCGSKTVII